MAAMFDPRLISPVLGLVLLFGPGPTQATLAVPTGSVDVVRAADDAFGRRIGVEQIGLYSESNVRGFNLEEAGNYRIENRYFVRAAAPANAVVAGTAVRVGVNALELDFPAPSGVVDFELRRAEPGVSGSVEAGVRANSGPFAEFNFGAASAEMGIAAGLQLYPAQTYLDGADGEFASIGAAGRWAPSARLGLTSFATATSWRYQADVGYRVGGAFLPPRVERRRYRGQRWTEVAPRTGVFGASATFDIADGWSLGVSAFRAQTTTIRGDFNLFSVFDTEGMADATAFRSPRQSTRAWSGEALLARDWLRNNARHRVVLLARGRESLARTGAGVAAAAGRFRLPGPAPAIDEPFLPQGTATRDAVRQWTLGASYRLLLENGSLLRGDVRRTRYRKHVATIGSPATERIAELWLWSAGGALRITPTLDLFGSFVRGLEESGVAPGDAANRNEVLPAVLASQAEIGVKQQLGRKLVLIAGAFQVEKPTPGRTADGRFDLIGDVRHRGLELSLAGAVTPRLNIVAGATLLDARLSEAAAARAGGERPTGRPDITAQVNASLDVAALPGLSVDGGLTYTGRERVDIATGLDTRAFAVVNAGLRYRFELGETAFTLRARATNLLNTFAWTATNSGLLFYNAPRSFALSLGATL